MMDLREYWAARHLLRGGRPPLKETLKKASKRMVILWVVKEVIFAIILIVFFV